jgi:hypothetical protein
MSVKLGRRASDIDPNVVAAAQWMEVLRKARAALLKTLSRGAVPSDTMVEIRFDEGVEKQLQECLGKIVLKPENIAEVVEQLRETGRLKVSRLPSMTEIYQLQPPVSGPRDG